MKAMSKAMIAVMVAAVMCAVPLFIIEDADTAGAIETKSAGASFKSGSIDDSKFNGFVSEGYKQYLAIMALDAVLSESVDMYDMIKWDITDIEIKNVKDIKLSKANEITDSKATSVDAQAIKFDISFKAKYTYAYTAATLFSMEDGTQALYKALGTNTIVKDDVIEINGTVTVDESENTVTEYQKVDSGKYVITGGTTKNFRESKFNGWYMFKEKKVTFERETKTSMEMKTTTDFDDKLAEVTSSTKAFRTISITDGGAVGKATYKVGDAGNTVSMEYGKDIFTVIGAMYGAGYVRGAAGDLGLVMDASDITNGLVPYVVYDSLDDDVALFTDAMLADAYHGGDKCVNFLKENGTVGTDYAAAKSVADSAYSTVSVSGSGGNNIIFYVIIGVLAVAVIALAVILIKKK